MNVVEGICIKRQESRALATAFNTSSSALHFYDMDNEVDIWGGTHRDVHPNPTGYEELRDTFRTEAGNLKGWDPAAVRLGPVSCCWWFYWNGAISVNAGTTPGFYQFSVTGVDGSGVTQTKDGWIVIGNPSATLTNNNTPATGAAGTQVTLSVTLNPLTSIGSPACNGASRAQPWCRHRRRSAGMPEVRPLGLPRLAFAPAPPAAHRSCCTSRLRKEGISTARFLKCSIIALLALLVLAPAVAAQRGRFVQGYVGVGFGPAVQPKRPITTD